MRIRFRFRLITFVAFLLLFQSKAQPWDSGLEIDGYKTIRIVVEQTSDDAIEMGLTQDLIQTKVNLQLRRNGITPTSDITKVGYVYVYVNVIGNGFICQVQFERIVTYTRSHTSRFTFETFGTTWDNTVFGTHGGSTRSVLDCMADSLDLFINAYLETNGE